ncbi:MAG: hypothetical protein ING28_08950, partial [Roseomonas sp.]|nr:hypothetical protein [Roseomonas sp.]
LGGSENAIKQAFSSRVASLGGSENAIRQAFSSQVASLGGSENAIKLGKCDQTKVWSISVERTRNGNVPGAQVAGFTA